MNVILFSRPCFYIVDIWLEGCRLSSTGINHLVYGLRGRIADASNSLVYLYGIKAVTADK